MAEKNRVVLIIEALKSRYLSKGVWLEYKTPFQLLVATMLSAQSTDIVANRLTKSLFKKYRSIQGFSRASLSVFEKDIFSSGFYRTKSRHIIDASKKILSDFNGCVPSTMEGLLALPGVGRKTANIVLSNAFKKTEGIAVDTHVGRISQRLGFSASNDPKRIEKDLMGLVPLKYWLDLNHMLVAFGRSVCRSRNPLCKECLIRKLCLWKNKKT
jgi:endonuclease III